MKKIRKVLSLLLIVCMMASMTLSVNATETSDSTQEQSNQAKATSEDDSSFMKIVHLDCGRKYFTKEWIIALINEMAADGYTHLQLAVGNDGLRFLLDDMSVAVGDTTYSSADVTAGIQAGNKAYYDAGEKNELTQSDMDEIIAAADKAGISIIPLINTPGHMDAIVDAAKYVGITNVSYGGSARTVDVTNEKAVAFTEALLNKYIQYFSGKGCEYFNIGADEYANDVYTSGGMGFEQLQNNGQYDEFVTYINELCALVKAKNMLPIAFNDGIYYNENTSSGTFDTDLIISYWSSGWQTYRVASASYLANKGHKMINTNGGFYYVLGKTDSFDSGYSAASNFSNTAFMGSTISEPIGSTFCIWCDYPDDETETEIASKIRLALRAMAKRMDGESITNLDSSVVTNGFNEDGTINSSTKTEQSITLDSGNSMKVGESQTLSIGAEATWTSSNQDVITLATKAKASETIGTQVTATATGEGNSTITATVDGTAYTAEIAVTNVVEEDLANAAPLTVDFWITNRVVDADGINEKDVVDGSKVVRKYYEYTVTSNANINSEKGIKFSDLVPSTGIAESKVTVFWKGTCLATDNWQTDANGVDKTLAGEDFTYVRYWGGNWAYSSDGTIWTNVQDGDQIVAYYLQKTQVTTEITTNVVDWGEPYKDWKALNGSFHWFWTHYVANGSRYVFLDYAVVYEDGTQNPAAFPTDNTWFFHFDGCSATNPRIIGAISFTDNEQYEIYKVTVTDGTSKDYESYSTFTSMYDDTTETVVWDESMGGEPHIDSLTYTANHSGKLVRVYVRTITEDSLTVHYIDQTAGNTEFYNYNIAVDSGRVFDAGFALGAEENTLVNNTVVNSKGVTQTVTANLSMMSEIGAQYRYSDYKCVNVVRSEDGKDVYLYYTFNNIHKFVIDFGLPLVITTEDLEISADDYKSVTVSGAKYGTAEVNFKEKELTYTPTKVLEETEILQLVLTDNNDTSSTHQIYIYPATTVYYEFNDVFADLGGYTMTGTAKTGYQETEKVGKYEYNYNYGYDPFYDNEATEVGPSDGAYVTSSRYGDMATLQFTGTGIGIYANCNSSTGTLFIWVKSNTTNKIVQVQTALLDGTTDATTYATTYGQSVEGYNVPVAVIDGLAHDSYTVTISHVKANANATGTDTVNLDGFRVYGTLEEQGNNVYVSDLEDNPSFIEMRDKVLTALSVSTKSDTIYAEQIAGNVLSQVYATKTESDDNNDEDTDVAVIIQSDNTASDDETIIGAEGTKEIENDDGSKITISNKQDLLDNGPKNEIYLQPGSTLVFKAKTKRVLQLGMKALNASVSYKINGEEATLSTSTDMFYKLADKKDEVQEVTYTITNSEDSEGILAITELKVCDDPNFTFKELTEDDIAKALASLGYESEKTYADATLNLVVADKVGNTLATIALTSNGIAGETAIFSAADIQAAVEALDLPEGYKLKDACYSDKTVIYGEEGTVTFTAEKKEKTKNPLISILDKVKDTFNKIFKNLVNIFTSKVKSENTTQKNVASLQSRASNENESSVKNNLPASTVEEKETSTEAVAEETNEESKEPTEPVIEESAEKTTDSSEKNKTEETEKAETIFIFAKLIEWGKELITKIFG